MIRATVRRPRRATAAACDAKIVGRTFRYQRETRRCPRMTERNDWRHTCQVLCVWQMFNV